MSDKKPLFGVLAGEPEIIGERCADGGACHHRCIYTCWRRTSCAPLSGSGLLPDWSVPNPADPALAQDEQEAPVVVATAILGGIYQGGSGPELGEIDIEVCMPALEALQCEMVNSSDDVLLPLMPVVQHERIVAALTRPAQTEQQQLVNAYRDMLDDLQWQWRDYNEQYHIPCGYYCPSCHAPNEKGHDADCELNALLASPIAQTAPQPKPSSVLASHGNRISLAPERSGRIYIAGPMTGLPDFNFPAFNDMAAILRGLGYHVENPAEHGVVEGAEWADYLRHDIARLATCEALVLLPGWRHSRGALLEVHIAKALGIQIMFAEVFSRFDAEEGA